MVAETFYFLCIQIETISSVPHFLYHPQQCLTQAEGDRTIKPHFALKMLLKILYWGSSCQAIHQRGRQAVGFLQGRSPLGRVAGEQCLIFTFCNKNNHLISLHFCHFQNEHFQCQGVGTTWQCAAFKRKCSPWFLDL